MSIGVFPLITFVVAAALFLAMHQLMTRTTIGRAFRAAADDYEILETLGFNRRRIYNAAMGLAVALSGHRGNVAGDAQHFHAVLRRRAPVARLRGRDHRRPRLAARQLSRRPCARRRPDRRIALQPGLRVRCSAISHFSSSCSRARAASRFHDWAIAHEEPGRSRRSRSLVLFAGAIFLPLDRHLAMEILLVFAMAQGWNLLCGYTGLFSFGHQAFVGLGAYALYVIGQRISASRPFAALPLSALACIAVALVMAWLLRGARDAYFSIGIWVLADSLRLLFGQWEFVGGSRGLVMDASAIDAESFNDESLLDRVRAGRGYRMIGVYALLRSRTGLALMAARDNEQGAASVGIAVARNRLMAFLVSAAICGVGGGRLLSFDSLRRSGRGVRSRLAGPAAVHRHRRRRRDPRRSDHRHDHLFRLARVDARRRRSLSDHPGRLHRLHHDSCAGGALGLLRARTGWQLFPVDWKAS